MSRYTRERNPDVLCTLHPAYRLQRKPVSNCLDCWEFWIEKTLKNIKHDWDEKFPEKPLETIQMRGSDVQLEYEV